MKEITNEQLYEYIKHYKFKDKMSWKFCAGILKQNFDIIISENSLRYRINKYMRENNINEFEEKREWNL